MDKRYQVFVSSTYEDLQEERKEVMQALLELDCIPAGMELFPASNEDQWTLIKRVIDDCDYYLLIIGGRYGSTNEEGKSYTQMEFEYALTTGKPVISFIRKNPETIPSGKCEKTEEGKKKLEEFKELAKKKIIRTWETPVELGSVVSRSMIKLIKQFPAEGWVKAGSIVDTESAKEIARLQKENRELLLKLQTVETTAPRGAEDLAQGTDLFDIHCTYTVAGDRAEHLTVARFTWDQIISFIGPYLLSGSSEEDLMEKLIEDCTEYVNRQAPFQYDEDIVRYLHISQNDFQRILIQLRALGIAQIAERKGVGENIWRLTSYGDNKLMQSMAIKRENVFL